MANTTPHHSELPHPQVFPLAKRRSLCRVEDILVEPASAPPPCAGALLDQIKNCAASLRQAREHGAAVILMYGAHLVRNGAALIIERLLSNQWLTHLATNGAGSIHDWEFAWLGRSTESVKENVANGTFGAWDETGRSILLALMAGSLQAEGYGRSLGRFIIEDGVRLPRLESLETALRQSPDHPLAPARADLLLAMRKHQLTPGWHEVKHAWKQASVLAQAYRHHLPATVHPGIGYDIITMHPMFDGAAIGRAAGRDFQLFTRSLDRLDRGVVLCVGSAVMAPQVFEKGLSYVHNLRRQQNRPMIQGHTIYVIDLQADGQWDWTQGEPPKTNPAYYLRFCKSFSRMGGTMHYLCCDNLTFLHHLYHQLQSL